MSGFINQQPIVKDDFGHTTIYHKTIEETIPAIANANPIIPIRKETRVAEFE